MSRYTGYEIISFGRGISAYGFGLLRQRDYIDHLPLPAEWSEMHSESKRQWLVTTNADLSRRIAL